MKQNFFQIIGLLVLFAILMAISCNKEEGEEPDPLVGSYKFTSASFNETVNIKIQTVDMEFLPDDDASQFVGDGLLGAAPCNNAQNAAIDLRSNGTTYFICLNESNEKQMGTWSINDERTVLTFNISYPQLLSLTISNLSITSTSFSGTVDNFPLPKDTSYLLGETLPGGGLNFQVASVDVTFTRVP